MEKNGLATFSFDFFGHGESEGKFEDLTITEGVKDVLAAIEFVKSKGYSNIGLVGSSFGGLASLLAAQKSKDLNTLVLKAPVSNEQHNILARVVGKSLVQIKEQGYSEYCGRKLNYSFFEDSQKIDGYENMDQIKIPTLIVHGDADDVVPIEQSKKAASLIKGCKLEIIEGEGHNFSGPGQFEKMVRLIAEFLVENLTNKK